MKVNSNYVLKTCASLMMLVGLLLTGCGAATYNTPPPQMVDPLSYVRQHKGEGARQVLVGTESELMDIVAKSFGEGGYVVIREPHAVIAKYTVPSDIRFSIAFAFYFYPAENNGQTEVEALYADPHADTTEIENWQSGSFISFFPLHYINMKMLEVGFDPNVKEGTKRGMFFPLTMAAVNDSRETAIKLINLGANIDPAIEELKEIASKQLSYLDKPLNKKAYDAANSGVEMLNGLKRMNAEKENEIAFQAALGSYQAAAVKPELPEDARRFKVQAEVAVRDKNFLKAIDLYGQGLKVAPWWPEGHFNRALVLAEANDFSTAIIEMGRYLALAPKANNARAAQDKIYEWEARQK